MGYGRGGGTYVRRQPETTVLHRVVREHLGIGALGLLVVFMLALMTVNLMRPRYRTQILAEWREIEARADTPEEKRVTSGIRRLAVRLQAERFLYLVFHGD